MTIFEFSKWLEDHKSSFKEFSAAAIKSKSNYEGDVTNLIAHLEVLLDSIPDVKGTVNNPIYNCVEWSYTTEGSAYWSALSVRWEEEIYRGKV